MIFHILIIIIIHMSYHSLSVSSVFTLLHYWMCYLLYLIRICYLGYFLVLYLVTVFQNEVEVLFIRIQHIFGKRNYVNFVNFV